MSLNAETATEKARPQPTYFKPEELSGLHALASGIRATDVGEDGEVMLIGHHDDDTALAALREFEGWRNGELLSKADLSLYAVERSYASFSDHNPGCELVCCECAEDACEACRNHQHDACDSQGEIGDDFCLCEDDFDHDVPRDRPFAPVCGCECWCDDHAWWAFTTRVGHEVTWIRYDHAKAQARMGTGDLAAAR